MLHTAAYWLLWSLRSLMPKRSTEPPRVCRRPYLLRGWGYDEEDIEPVFA
jgi:hypothetical protein